MNQNEEEEKSRKEQTRDLGRIGDEDLRFCLFL